MLSHSVSVNQQEEAAQHTNLWVSPAANATFSALTLVLVAIVPLLLNQGLPQWAVWLVWGATVSLGLLVAISFATWGAKFLRPRIARRKANARVSDTLRVVFQQLEQLLNWSHTNSAGAQLNQIQELGLLSAEGAGVFRSHLSTLAANAQFVSHLLERRKIDSVDALGALSETCRTYLRLTADLNTLIHNAINRNQDQAARDSAQRLRRLLRDWSEVRVAANGLAQEMTRMVALAKVTAHIGISTYFPTISEA